MKRQAITKLQKHTLWIVPVCILLGIIIAMQYKQFQSELDLGGTSANFSTLTKQYNDLKVQKEILENDIEQLQKQLELAITGNAEGSVSPNMSEELQYYMMAGGFTDVTGPGVTIQFDLPESDSLVNLTDFYQELIMLVNELHAAGAEAISIKDERIIANSEIRLASSAIMINGKPLMPPFVIKAIGDPETLQGALTMRFGFVDNARNNGYFIEIRKNDAITILKYPTKPFFRHAETTR